YSGTRWMFDSSQSNIFSRGHVSANVELNIWRLFIDSSGNSGTYEVYGNGRLGFTSRLLVGSQPNTLNLSTPLIPIYIFTDIGGPASSGNCAPLGVVKDLRLVW